MSAEDGWPDFLDTELSEAERGEGALFHVLPVPLERTVSYGGGTAEGPRAILLASGQLERLCPGGEGGGGGSYDEPCRHGIRTHPAHPCEGLLPEVLAALRARARAVAEAGGVPVTLGGEHSLTWGPALGVRDAVGPIGIVQIDAHADLRDAYEGEPHSHASVMHLLAREGVPIAQAGVRALAREELAARAAHGIVAWDGLALARGTAAEIALPEGFPRNLYVSFDVDGLDPSAMPATGTPVPGGLGFEQALAIVERLAAGRRVVGLDVVELAPHPAHPHCDFAAAQLAYRLMAIAARSA